jgi:hypothetical protein
MDVRNFFAERVDLNRRLKSPGESGLPAGTTIRSVRRMVRFVLELLLLSGPFFLSPDGVLAGVAGGDPVPASVLVRGSSVTLFFVIPDKPAGPMFHLSIDHGRLLGRSVKGRKTLTVCVDRLSPGKHLLGYELAGPDQIVRTEEQFITVEIKSGGPSVDCPATGGVSRTRRAGSSGFRRA